MSKHQFRTSISVERQEIPQVHYYDIRVGGGRLNGRVNHDESAAYLEDVEVWSSKIRKGRGAHLVKTFAELAIDGGVKKMVADFVSLGGLTLCASVFGIDNMKFFEQHEGADTELPMTIEQAAASAERFSERVSDHDPEGYYGVRAEIDLAAYQSLGNKEAA